MSTCMFVGFLPNSQNFEDILGQQNSWWIFVLSINLSSHEKNIIF